MRRVWRFAVLLATTGSQPEMACTDMGTTGAGDIGGGYDLPLYAHRALVALTCVRNPTTRVRGASECVQES